MPTPMPPTDALPPGAGPDEPPAAVLETSPSGVAVVTLNRPAKRNAFGPDLILALADIFETLRAADHVRIVLLRGAGGCFSAGADLAWMAETADWMEDDNREDALRLANMLKKLHDLPQLTVALVEGFAFGGGAGLVAACDAAIAARGAVFAFSEVRLGLVAATISPYVVRALGPRSAKFLMASGRRFSADEAQRLGLVQEVVEDGPGLDQALERITADMDAAAPEAVRASKRLVEEVFIRPLDAALLDRTARLIAETRASPEGREGVRAFLDRRAPSWRTQ